MSCVNDGIYYHWAYHLTPVTFITCFTTVNNFLSSVTLFFIHHVGSVVIHIWHPTDKPTNQHLHRAVKCSRTAASVVIGQHVLLPDAGHRCCHIKRGVPQTLLPVIIVGWRLAPGRPLSYLLGNHEVSCIGAWLAPRPLSATKWKQKRCTQCSK